MAVGTTSGPFKKKPNRIRDKLRKLWQKPSGGKTSTVPYKKKPPRKGRPDGA